MVIVPGIYLSLLLLSNVPDMAKAATTVTTNTFTLHIAAMAIFITQVIRVGFAIMLVSEQESESG